MAQRRVCSDEFGDSFKTWGRINGSGASIEDGELFQSRGALIRGASDRTQLDLITIEAARHVVVRTEAHIQRTETPLHIIPVQLRGRSSLRPSGGRAPVRFETGDIGYWTSDLPYRWEFSGPFTLMVLRTPFAAVSVTPAALRPLIGHSFASTTGFARLVVPFAEDVLNDPALLQGASGIRIVQNLVSLFTTMLVGELEDIGDREPSAPSFRRVAEYISAHLAEPLDLRGIARANDMSTRYVQSLFQDRGLTVSQWIRTRRLESARQALADPAFATTRVTRIAADHGFADHAHFARTFRAAFNETPSQWRAAALGIRKGGPPEISVNPGRRPPARSS